MIKTILFDMGGVLFQIDTDQAKRRFEALGVDSERYLDAYEQRGIFLDLESGAIGDEEFVSRLSDMVGHPVSKEEARHRHEDGNADEAAPHECRHAGRQPLRRKPAEGRAWKVAHGGS